MGTNQENIRNTHRHILATLAYRTSKVFRDAPPEFGCYKADPHSRTPVQIVAHMGDLLDWTLSLAQGEGKWREAVPQIWDREIARFYQSMKRLDSYFAGSEPIASPFERLFQGPIADALTHTGQLAMLRRLIGFPMKGENYFKSDIVIGNVGPDQAKPVREF